MAPSRTDAYILTGQSDCASSGLPTGKEAVIRLRKKRAVFNFFPALPGDGGQGESAGATGKAGLP